VSIIIAIFQYGLWRKHKYKCIVAAASIHDQAALVQ